MMKNDTVSRSWFCVFNNPEEHGYDGLEPKETLEKMVRQWEVAFPGGACFMTYCISAEGLKHVHAVLEPGKPARFSAVQKVFPGMHIEQTKGSKSQVRDYMNKSGKFEEKGEEVIAKDGCGEIEGSRQGKRSDLDEITAYLDDGMNPEQIFEIDLKYRKFANMVKQDYYARRLRETPSERKLSVFYHVGPSGSGKSHVQVDLKEQHGAGEVYVMTDYQGGGLDGYCGQRILFMDEFRGEMRLSQFLTMLDRYPNDLHARYSNVKALWTEVHIATVLPPEQAFKNMADGFKEHDKFEQMQRRITSVIYHEKREGEYLVFEKPMSEYSSYDELQEQARKQWENYLGQ